MWKRQVLIGCVLLMGWMGGSGAVVAVADDTPGKYAIILQAGTETHEGMARAVHALLYAKELKEHGHQVVLIFDGAGTAWIEVLTNPNSTSTLQPLYAELTSAGITYIICDYCATAFAVKDALVARKEVLNAAYSGHPSIATWADQGYQLVIL
jgi:hypothetical protein